MTHTVSIHTPTKGVTSKQGRRADLHLSFNPHTHEGCDYARLAMPGETACFNPHTHEGCDGRLRLKDLGQGVSIHTPTKGVT